MTTLTADSDPAESARVLFDRLSLSLRVAIPAVVVAVADDGRHVDVQPAVSLVQRLEENETVDLPVLRGVPVHIYGSQSAGLFVTVPIRPGDDGTLIFNDRALDNWQYGDGILPPPDMASPRHHDLTDATFIPGLQRDSGGVPAYSSTSVEVRSKDGTTKVSVSQTEVQAITSGASVSVTGTAAVLAAETSSLTVTAAGIAIVGGLTINGHNYLTHSHSNPEGGDVGPVIP